MLDFKNMEGDVVEPLPDEPLPGVKGPKEIPIHSLDCSFNEPPPNPGVMKHLVTAAKAYGIKKDKLKEEESSLKKRKAELREKELALFDMFEAVGITSIKADGRTYFTRVDTYASVDAGNREVAHEWIKEIGCDYLIIETVNAQSLTREVKAYVEDGGNIPGEDQGIKVRTENRVRAPKG